MEAVSDPPAPAPDPHPPLLTSQQQHRQQQAPQQAQALQQSAVSRLAQALARMSAATSRADDTSGSLLQVWLPMLDDDGQVVLSTQGRPFAISGVGDLLALFRCVSARYRFSTDLSQPAKLGAVGRVYTSCEPVMTHDIQSYDRAVYLRIGEAQRCRVHSTLMLPVFDGGSEPRATAGGGAWRQRPVAVFELVQTERTSFASVIQELRRCLRDVSMATADPAALVANIAGLRRWPLQQQQLELDLGSRPLGSAAGTTHVLKLEPDEQPQHQQQQQQQPQQLGGAAASVSSSQPFPGEADGDAVSGSSGPQQLQGAELQQAQQVPLQQHQQAPLPAASQPRGSAFDARAQAQLAAMQQADGGPAQLPHGQQLQMLQAQMQLMQAHMQQAGVLQAQPQPGQGRVGQQHLLLLTPLQGPVVQQQQPAHQERQHQQQLQQPPPQLLLAQVDTGSGEADADDDFESDEDEAGDRPYQPGAIGPARHLGAGRRLTFEDLQAQFGLGLKEAATNLGICATTLKRACRRVGITRWPRRQIAKLNRTLTQIDAQEAPLEQLVASAIRKNVKPAALTPAVTAGFAQAALAAGSAAGGKRRASSSGGTALPRAGGGAGSLAGHAGSGSCGEGLLGEGGGPSGLQHAQPGLSQPPGLGQLGAAHGFLLQPGLAWQPQQMLLQLQQPQQAAAWPLAGGGAPAALLSGVQLSRLMHQQFGQPQPPQQFRQPLAPGMQPMQPGGAPAVLAQPAAQMQQHAAQPEPLAQAQGALPPVIELPPNAACLLDMDEDMLLLDSRGESGLDLFGAAEAAAA